MDTNNFISDWHLIGDIYTSGEDGRHFTDSTPIGNDPYTIPTKNIVNEINEGHIGGFFG